MIFIAYAAVIVWYFQHGRPAQDVKVVQEQLPWYRQKREPSFADMLAAARRVFWLARLSRHPLLRGVARKIVRSLPHWLLSA